MKRYIIPAVIVMAVLAVAWTAFGQDEEQAAKQRERVEQRFKISSERNQKSIKAIEEQLAKLKASQMPWPEGRFQDLSEDERAEFIKKARTVMQKRQEAFQAIIVQVARLQGRRQSLEEGEKLLMISTNDLKRIQESATKEKAKETSQLLERLIAREGRGFGRGR